MFVIFRTVINELWNLSWIFTNVNIFYRNVDCRFSQDWLQYLGKILGLCQRMKQTLIVARNETEPEAAFLNPGIWAVAAISLGRLFKV